jgi:hypothetical protein
MLFWSVLPSLQMSSWVFYKLQQTRKVNGVLYTYDNKIVLFHQNNNNRVEGGTILKSGIN